mmetsp:Transcript_19776/g.19003  ORF Transcript_19776/g.19003 Transcript_19776/m.19003 type:complete len:470 (-) Transcript_19776:291-1700(-)
MAILVQNKTKRRQCVSETVSSCNWRLLVLLLLVIPVVNNLSSGASLSVYFQNEFEVAAAAVAVNVSSLQAVVDDWGREPFPRGHQQQLGQEPIVRRMLFGIFTYDSPNEHLLRQTNRAALWRVFKNRAARGGSGSLGGGGYDDENIMDSLTANNTNENVVCTLSELMQNETLARSTVSCRFVFTFVMGGGDAGNQAMRTKLTQKANDFNAGRKGTEAKKKEEKDFINFGMKPRTRCLYEDPECGGIDLGKWVIPDPADGSNASEVWKSELDRHRSDTTILGVPENHQLGKTDTWFTYASMLTRWRPDLGIDFVGKMDGDNSMRFHTLARFLIEKRDDINAHPYVHGGWVVPRNQCQRPSWGRVCAGSEFIAPLFVTGAISYLSTPLAQSVYLDGTTLEQKQDVWIGLEDVQVSNMAYSNPKIDPGEILVLNHRGRPKPDITEHCSNKPSCLRQKYCKAYPGLFPELCER